MRWHPAAGPSPSSDPHSCSDPAAGDETTLLRECSHVLKLCSALLEMGHHRLPSRNGHVSCSNPPWPHGWNAPGVSVVIFFLRAIFLD